MREEHNGNDLSALKEVMARRLQHPEWRFPDMMIVDGALLQLGVAEKMLADTPLRPSLVGVVKNEKHKAERLIGPEALVHRFRKDILLANTEAHRFAITYHRKRRDMGFLPE